MKLVKLVIKISCFPVKHVKILVLIVIIKNLCLTQSSFYFIKVLFFDMTNYLFFRLLQKTKSLSNCYVYNTASGLLSQ